MSISKGQAFYSICHFFSCIRAIGVESPQGKGHTEQTTLEDRRVIQISRVAAKALATYLIPGCVGRGVKLGSETSSGAGGPAGGGVWKSGNLEFWEFGDLGTWKSENLEIWGPGNPESWDTKNQKTKKQLKIQIRSAQKVGKVWISREKKLPAPFGAI